MSKVYEALQRAALEQDIATPKQREISDTQFPDLLGPRRSRPLKMGREMNRLHHSIVSRLCTPRNVLLLFIGSKRNEGTSTLAREFACYLTEKVGKYVLLVDGDREQLSQHRAFNHRANGSLHDMMAGESLARAVSQVRQSALYLTHYSAGAPTHDGSSLPVESSDIWPKLRMEFDFTLIDSPPVSDSEEGLALCSVVDGVVLVVEAEQTRSHVAVSTKNRIVQQGGNILGLVFNKQRYYIPEWIYRRL
jgi:protein-tyrosine kinase